MPQARIFSRPKWNLTDIKLEAGKKYNLQALGIWVDFFIPCDPDGYPCPSFLKQKLRYPQANLFKLLGSIDSDENLMFVIGSSLAVLTAPKTGMLTCCANDLENMYWNNWGSIDLTVSPLE